MNSADNHHNFKHALCLRNWAIALSSIASALFLFPFTTAVAFGYPNWVLLTSTTAGMVACAILQILCFLIVLYLAQHHWGCVNLLPGIDASLAICIIGSMTEFIAFIASGCFNCPNDAHGGCCYTPIGPVLPAVLIGIGLSVMATIFVSQLLPEPHHHQQKLVEHQRIVNITDDIYLGENSKYGTLE
jgi:hypothetical protein